MLMKREILHMIFAMLIVSLSALSSTPSQVNGTHEQDDIVIDSRNPAVMFQYFTEKERRKLLDFLKIDSNQFDEDWLRKQSILFEDNIAQSEIDNKIGKDKHISRNQMEHGVESHHSNSAKKKKFHDLTQIREQLQKIQKKYKLGQLKRDEALAEIKVLYKQVEKRFSPVLKKMSHSSMKKSQIRRIKELQRAILAAQTKAQREALLKQLDHAMPPALKKNSLEALFAGVRSSAPQKTHRADWMDPVLKQKLRDLLAKIRNTNSEDELKKLGSELKKLLPKPERENGDRRSKEYSLEELRTAAEMKRKARNLVVKQKESTLTVGEQGEIDVQLKDLFNDYKDRFAGI